MFALSLLVSLNAFATSPAVPPVKQTACYQQTVKILKTEYNDFRIVDGIKLGAEFVDATDFAALPVRQYSGMNGEHYFGLVGYARVRYHGDATTHLYNYIVSASCTYDEATKKYVLDDENLDGKLDKDDITLTSMDFER